MSIWLGITCFESVQSTLLIDLYIEYFDDMFVFSCKCKGSYFHFRSLHRNITCLWQLSLYPCLPKCKHSRHLFQSVPSWLELELAWAQAGLSQKTQAGLAQLGSETRSKSKLGSAQAWNNWLYFSLYFSPVSSPIFSPLFHFTPFPFYVSLI